MPYEDIKRIQILQKYLTDFKKELTISVARMILDSQKKMREELNGFKATPGPKGDKGDDGGASLALPGEDGYTPKKNVDYFDGKDGVEIPPEEVVKKINSLSIDPELQIDARHIKNLPVAQKWKTIKLGGRGMTQVVGETPTGTINGTNATFTVANPPTNLRVYLNGARVSPGGVDYTLTGSSIVFVTAPPTDSIILVDYEHS